MADAFDDINDELRREKLHQFWKENGSWIIGGALGAILLTGALTFWRQWEYSRNAAATTEMTRVINTADLAKIEAFAKTSDKNHGVMAKLIAAGQHLDRHENDQALALYNDIAKTSGIDKSWRELAKVLSIGLRLDKDDPKSLEKELADLSSDKGIWRYTAREMEALVAAREGKMDKAVESLTRITADPLAPEDARRRAFSLRELYIADVKTESKS